MKKLKSSQIVDINGGVNACFLAGAGAVLSLLAGPVAAVVYATTVGPMMIYKCT